MAQGVFSFVGDEEPFLRRLMLRGMEALAGVTAIEAVYQKWQQQDGGSTGRVYGSMLESYGIDLHFKGRWPIEKLPDGPILMVSNHPFGIADGMALGAIAEHFGRPRKALVIQRLMKIPAFRPFILPISFDETPEALQTNLNSRNEAVRMLKEGSVVALFPAGGVATAPRGFGLAEELPWKLFLPKLIQLGQANVLPIYMEGQNSLLFHMVSRMSFDARSLLLFREFHKQCGKPITINIGEMLPWSELSRIGDRRARLEHVRQAVYAMQPPDVRRRPPAPERLRQNHPLWREDARLTLGDVKMLRRDRPVPAPAKEPAQASTKESA